MSWDEEKGEEEEEDGVHQWKETLGRRRNGNYRGNLEIFRQGCPSERSKEGQVEMQILRIRSSLFMIKWRNSGETHDNTIKVSPSRRGMERCLHLTYQNNSCLNSTTATRSSVVFKLRLGFDTKT